MKLPVVHGIIDRRVLVNFRVDPEILQRTLPPPFRPKLAHGRGVAGICLIRLSAVRPRFVPAFLGLRSENAAHRVAVEWDTSDGIQEAVYIPRRDTSAWANRAAGGRVFPGRHERAHFEVTDSPDEIAVSMRSADGVTRVTVRGTVTNRLSESSIFADLDKASRFFEAGSLGYSATSDPRLFDGLELRTKGWRVEPLDVSIVSSSFFDDGARFPSGSVAFDNALLMRNLEHEWHAREPLCCSSEAMPTGAV